MRKTLASLTLLVATFTATAAAAHTGDPSEVPLHVDDAYGSCFFDLHPELTQAEFDEFTGEAGAILRFQQVGDARTLGRGRFEVGLQLTRTPIDDSKGAWNNTMSHPAADHYLGHDIAFPRLVARVGVHDRVDVGLWGSLDPQANYGFIGAEAKLDLMHQGRGGVASLALRPSATVLLGPEELWAANGSLDLSLSRSFGGLSPYLGVGGSASLAFERSPDVALDAGVGLGLLGFAGLAYEWRALSLAAQVEVGTLVTTSLHAGGRF